MKTLLLLTLLAASAMSAPAHPVQYEDLKLLPSDGASGDEFGASVAISGSTVIVGAYLDDDNGDASGSAYILDATTGQQLFKLLPADGAAYDYFGVSVAISGSTAIVGAYVDDDNGINSGSAYLFDATTGQQLFKLTPSDGAANDYFGRSVAISGNIAIVGAYGDIENGFDSGSAYLFDVTTGQQFAKLLPSDATYGHLFGYSVAICGNTAIVGAFGDSVNAWYAGAAYLFDVTTGEQLYKLVASDGTASDDFGFSVAISGNIAIVGTAEEDDADGPVPGSAYLFDVTTGQQLFKLLSDDGAAEDFFGTSVAISGNTAIVGALGDDDNGTFSGSAYLFDATTGQQLAKLLSSDGAAEDTFGYAVAISGSTAIVGTDWDDDNGTNSGSAYIFNLSISQPCPGDINADDTVNLADFDILATNFGFGPGATLSHGDLNSDGFVNLADFNLFAVNFGNTCP